MQILSEYHELFNGKIGLVKGEVSIILKKIMPDPIRYQSKGLPMPWKSL